MSATNLLATYHAYAEAWETAYVTGDWAPLAPFFTDDGVYEVVAGPPMDVAFRGRDAMLAGFADAIDRFDKRFDARVAVMTEGPVEDAPDSIMMRFRTSYSLAGAPDIVLTGIERAVFREGRIHRLENLMDTGVAEAVFQWYGEHIARLPAPPSLRDRPDEVPVTLFPAAALESWWLPLPEQGHVAIVLSPGNSASNQLSAGVHHLPAGGSLPEYCFQRSDFTLHLEAGAVTVEIDGVGHDLEPGDTIAIGRHRRICVQVAPGAPARLFWLCAPGGYERLLRSIGRRRHAGTAHPGPSDIAIPRDYYSGPTHLQSHRPQPGGHTLVRLTDRASYWQSLPSTGSVDILISPFNYGSNSFAVGTQRLEAGAMIPPHAHRRNEELLYVLAGSGLALDASGAYPIGLGDAVFTGRYARHGIVASDGPLSLLWVFSPPELEVALAETGRPRIAGEAPPPPFPPAAEMLGVFEQHSFAPL